LYDAGTACICSPRLGQQCSNDTFPKVSRQLIAPIEAPDDHNPEGMPSASKSPWRLLPVTVRHNDDVEKLGCPHSMARVDHQQTKHQTMSPKHGRIWQNMATAHQSTSKKRRAGRQHIHLKHTALRYISRPPNNMFFQVPFCKIYVVLSSC
jgi:hypothetical protein